MPRRNSKKKRPVMLCSCGKRIPLNYTKTHIDRCQRAYRRRRSERGNHYPKGA